MTDKMQPPRTTSRSSPTTGLLVLIAALGLVGSLLYSQPITRAYRWIAYADTRLPLDAYNNRVNTSVPGNTAHTSSSGGSGRSDLPGSP